MSKGFSSAAPGRVLMVSKPVVPPWNDSSKNLVRDLVQSLTRYEASVMTKPGTTLGFARGHALPIYRAGAGGYAPPLADNARVLWTLLTQRGHPIWHFFFAPNRRTSRVSALATQLRGARSVQTVCSMPRDTSRLGELLFADRIVVLSQATQARVLAAGVDAARVRCIPPAVRPLEARTVAQMEAMRRSLGVPVGSQLVLYPGDLEFSSGAECMIRAHASLCKNAPVTLLLACRAKTPRATHEQARLVALIETLGLGASTRFVGERSDIHDVLAAADVVALPADSLYAKMDLPLVLIEAMMLGKAVVTSSTTAAAELASGDAALAVAPEPNVVADAIGELLTNPQRLSELGQRARLVAQSRYEPTRMAPAYESVYDELVR